MPKNKSAAEKAHLADVYKRLFSTPDGKIVLKDLKDHFFVDRTTHVPGDPHGSSLNEGLRMAFLHIVNRQKKSLIPILQEED